MKLFMLYFFTVRCFICFYWYYIIFILDGSMDKNSKLEVLCIVEWLLKKLNSNNLYYKLSIIRSLANFSRFSK